MRLRKLLSAAWHNLLEGQAHHEALECSSMGVDPAFIRPKPSGQKPLSEAQETQMAKVIALLKKQGTITTFEANKVGGTVDARKMFTRMRKLALLYPANDKAGFCWEKNSHNGGRHKVHFLMKRGAK